MTYRIETEREGTVTLHIDAPAEAERRKRPRRKRSTRRKRSGRSGRGAGRRFFAALTGMRRAHDSGRTTIF